MTTIKTNLNSLLKRHLTDITNALGTCVGLNMYVITSDSEVIQNIFTFGLPLETGFSHNDRNGLPRAKALAMTKLLTSCPLALLITSSLSYLVAVELILPRNKRQRSKANRKAWFSIMPSRLSLRSCLCSAVGGVV